MNFAIFSFVFLRKLLPDRITEKLNFKKIMPQKESLSLHAEADSLSDFEKELDEFVKDAPLLTEKQEKKLFSQVVTIAGNPTKKIRSSNSNEFNGAVDKRWTADGRRRELSPPNPNSKYQKSCSKNYKDKLASSSKVSKEGGSSKSDKKETKRPSSRKSTEDLNQSGLDLLTAHLSPSSSKVSMGGDTKNNEAGPATPIFGPEPLVSFDHKAEILKTLDNDLGIQINRRKAARKAQKEITKKFKGSKNPTAAAKEKFDDEIEQLETTILEAHSIMDHLLTEKMRISDPLKFYEEKRKKAIEKRGSRLPKKSKGIQTEPPKTANSRSRSADHFQAKKASYAEYLNRCRDKNEAVMEEQGDVRVIRYRADRGRDFQVRVEPSGDRQVYDARSSEVPRGRGKAVRGRYGDERDDMTTGDTDLASSIAVPGRYDGRPRHPQNDWINLDVSSSRSLSRSRSRSRSRHEYKYNKRSDSRNRSRSGRR